MDIRKKILIVDDERSVRQSLTNFLEDFDFSVESAASAEQGLELLEQTEFDLAIVDIRLPGIDGNQFILKANIVQPRLQFIVHTGANYYSLPSELKKIGMTMNQVFLKPISDLNHFIKVIVTM